ncbi:MAG: glycosyltransferase family 4 protein [Gemmatimonadetes bacterium]|nr:glycosyltransferase family 4 protein [Gemmatimonadota bacterium]
MAPEPVQTPHRVLLACTGLGNERRGFETFTRDVAQALAAEPTLAVEVFAGGRDGHVPGEHVVANLPRRSRAAHRLGAMLGRDPYFIEQGSFFLGLLPALALRPPHLVYFADLNLGNALWHWRRLTGARWRMLFYNGGNTTMPYTRCDHVQQLTPAALDAAAARGERAERMTLLPHGVSLPPLVEPSTDAARREARRAARVALGLPVDREILLSVGQLDRPTKRTDLLIEAVAALPTPRPFLLLVGADGPDGAGLRALATERLGDGWGWRTEPRERMGLVYASADTFALLSRGEGFGLAYVEALGAGLPLLAHDDATTAYVVGDAGLRRAIATREDAVAAIGALRALPTDAAAARTRRASVAERFGWATLAPRYVALLTRVATGPI